MQSVTCPGCGAPATREMLAAGECGYCHVALLKPQDARERGEPPRPPQVTIQIHAPTVDVGGAGQAVGMVGRQAVGCASGCISTAFTLAFMALIFGYVAFQLWAASAPMPRPAPAPHPAVERPVDRSPDHPRGKRR